MQSTVRIAWGMDSTGRARHASQVERGKACGCVCPDCKTALIAHQGEKYAKHFRHATTTACRGESALHLAGKQALVDAAARHAPVTTPEVSGTLSRTDIGGEEHLEGWQVPVCQFVFAQANCEAAIGNDLRADVVLAPAAEDSPLAIEIRVTHAKGEIEQLKYAAYNHDALEIDLSMLAWNASPDEVSQAVLVDAPREWIHYGAAVTAQADARSRLTTRVREINERLERLLDETTARLRDESWLISTRFPWPELVEFADDGSSWSGRASASPKFTALDAHWVRHAALTWKGFGVVNGKTPAAIEIGLASAKSAAERKQPTLVIGVNPRGRNTDFLSSLSARWEGIEKWRAKLKRNAWQSLHNSHKTLLPGGLGYLEDFTRLSSEDQMKEIAHAWLQDLDPPITREWCSAWNTDFAVWRCVIWYDAVLWGLFRGSPMLAEPGLLASSHFYSDLLSWSDDDDDFVERWDDIERFLVRLEERGILEREGRGFRANLYPRQRVVPWEI